MRLIDARKFVNGEQNFFLEHYDGYLPYAIISHRWEDEEVSFQDVQQIHTSPHLKERKGYRKVVNSCLWALKDCIRYVWIDTCCIDKTSSSELQESINSMFYWYKESMICYVYLSDIPIDFPPIADDLLKDDHKRREQFESSVWFTRAWTLQELLAPKHLVFHSVNWSRICTLGDVVHSVAYITAIDARVLLHDIRLPEIAVAQRMSWAACREATRIEDVAYSLLGIFDVNMPMLYGERDKAFQRLQENIIRTHTDQSIFSWYNRAYCGGSTSLLASSPTDFLFNRRTCLWDQFSHPFELTNAGLRLQTSLVHIHGIHYAAILNSTSEEADIAQQYVHALNLTKRPYGRKARRANISDLYEITRKDCSHCAVSKKTRPVLRWRSWKRVMFMDKNSIALSKTKAITIAREESRARADSEPGRKRFVSIVCNVDSHVPIELEDEGASEHLWSFESPWTKLSVPDQFSTPRETAIDSENLRLGTDFISGYVGFRDWESRVSLYVVVVVVKPLRDVMIFDVGLVVDRSELPLPSTTWEGLATRKKLDMGGSTYEISPFKPFKVDWGSDDTLYFKITRKALSQTA